MAGRAPAEVAVAVTVGLSRYRWAIAGVWALAILIMAFHRFALVTLVPTLASEFRLSYAAAGALTSSYFLAYAALQLPAGILVDRFGPRRVLLASLALLSAGVLLFPFVPSFEAALALRIVIGLGAAAIWLCGVKLIYVWFPPSEYSRVTGLAGGCAPLADLFALWLVPPLTMALAWRFGYFVTALAAPLVLLLCWRVLRLPAQDEAPGHDATRPSASLSANLRAVFANGRLWALGVALLLYFGGYVGAVSWLPTYYRLDLGYGATAGFLAGFASLALPLAMPLAGFVADRMGRREAVCAAFAFANALLLAALPLVGPRLDEQGLIVLTLLISISFAGFILPYSLLPSLVPVAAAGTATGLLNTLAYGTNFVYPIALGRVADAAQSLTPIFLIVAAASALAGLIALRLSVGRRP